MSDSLGRLVVDERIAGGRFGTLGAVGWKTNGEPATKWTYIDKSSKPAAANGIAKVVISVRKNQPPSLFKIVVVGRDGRYPVAADAVPVTFAVELNDRAVPPGGDARHRSVRRAPIPGRLVHPRRRVSPAQARVSLVKPSEGRRRRVTLMGGDRGMRSTHLAPRAASVSRGSGSAALRPRRE